MRRVRLPFVVIAMLPAITMAAPAPGTLLPPVASGCISSPFGPRILPGLPKAGTYHYGLDMPGPAGGAVRAAAAGRVITVHRRGAGGLFVVLQHADPAGGGFTTMYAHLGMLTPALAEGKREVAAGEKLGVVGRSGVTYGTHVYFELRIAGEPVDPAPYLGIAPCRQPSGAGQGASSLGAPKDAAGIAAGGADRRPGD